MTPQIIGAVLRHVLGAVGAVGVVSENEADQLAGALTVLFAIGWSVWQKYQAQPEK